MALSLNSSELDGVSEISLGLIFEPPWLHSG